MTSKERDALDTLRTELHGYHSDVLAYITKCDTLEHEVGHLATDMYGNPEDRAGSPGVLTQVNDLRKSRKVLISIVTGAWTIATILFGALMSRVW